VQSAPRRVAVFQTLIRAKADTRNEIPTDLFQQKQRKRVKDREKLTGRNRIPDQKPARDQQTKREIVRKEDEALNPSVAFLSPWGLLRGRILRQKQRGSERDSTRREGGNRQSGGFFYEAPRREV
jgi:hypothetical protein